MKAGGELRPGSHPDKDVRTVLEQLCKSGEWTLVKGGHWGILRCVGGAQCCSLPISGTPRNGWSHAQQIKRYAAQHPRDESDPRHKGRGLRRGR